MFVQMENSDSVPRKLPFQIYLNVLFISFVLLFIFIKVAYY